MARSPGTVGGDGGRDQPLEVARGHFCSFHRFTWKRITRGVLALGMLLGQVMAPASVAAAGPTEHAFSPSFSFNLGQPLAAVAAMFGLGVVSDTSPEVGTHDVSPSTPWTVLVGGVSMG